MKQGAGGAAEYKAMGNIRRQIVIVSDVSNSKNIDDCKQLSLVNLVAACNAIHHGGSDHIHIVLIDQTEVITICEPRPRAFFALHDNSIQTTVDD